MPTYSNAVELVSPNLTVISFYGNNKFKQVLALTFWQ